jgi:serine/threonine protein kinase
MQPERWRRIEELYHSAREREPNSRREFLAAACGSDDQLRRQVELLLDQDTAREGVLDRPPDDLLTDQTCIAFTEGTRLGPYRIEALLGKGGMGEVFRALDTRLDRHVAIKVSANDISGRFAREARAIAALNHPHICTLHDVGPNYLVMELVEGETLSDLLRKGPLSIRLALRYAVQITDAVTAAHARGIVHRDIKPGNIMITQSGVKVLDFGLAKLIRPSASSPLNPFPGAPECTETGVLLGTAGYMSPEQAEGRELDERSDIFSFGAVLYEMTTGRKPFAANSRISVLTRIVNDDPTPPRQISTSIPPGVEKIILRCLNKEPAQRYQMMAGVRTAVENENADSIARPPAGLDMPFRRGSVWAAFLTLLVVLGYFAGSGFVGSQQPEPLRATALTTFPGAELFPSLSPDGNQVVFSWNGRNRDNSSLYVQTIGGAGNPLQLTTGAANDYSPDWSPDGRWIAFLRTKNQPPMFASWAPIGRSELRLVSPLGSPDRLLSEIVVREQSVIAPRLAWCPDSTCLLVTDSPGEGKPDALFLISLETGQKRQLTYPQQPVAGDSNPAIAPDGHSLIFRRNIGYDTGELYSIQMTNRLTPKGEPERLTKFTMDAAYPAWMPDSKSILFSAKQSLWRLAPEHRRNPARLPFIGEDGVMAVVSRTTAGRKPRLVYARNLRDWNIWQITPTGPNGVWQSRLAAGISSTKPDANPQFSPDGRRIAFESSRSGENEIWVAEADGSNTYQLTAMGASDTGTPRWSSDGQQITFDSNMEGHYEVYIVAASGGQPRRITSNSAANSQLPDFSRDGRSIYFTSNRTGSFEIWKMLLSGDQAIQITHNGAFGGWESPDGNYVYYTRYRTPELWRVPIKGGEPVKVIDKAAGYSIALFPDGIYYRQRLPAESILQFFDFATSRSRIITRNLGPILPGLTVSPDRRTILYTRVDSTDADLMMVEDFKLSR